MGNTQTQSPPNVPASAQNTTIRTCNEYSWGLTVLGTGEYSTVFLGINNTTKQSVAVKSISARNLTKQRRLRLKQELTILNQVGKIPNAQQHFVTLKTSFLDKSGNLCIVTDLIEGNRLLDLMGQYPSGLPEASAKSVLKNIFLGVKLLHQNNIAHRDIKLENIIYDRKSQSLRLIDFGFATSTKSTGSDETTTSSQFCGSIHYCAPEIVSEHPYVPEKVDIWALGVLTVVLLTGHFPFDNPREEILVSRINSGQYFLPKSLSPVACNFIQKMLCVDPAQRFTINQLIAHPWIAPLFKTKQ